MTLEKEALARRIRTLVIRRFCPDSKPRDISPQRSLFELGVGVDSVSTLEFVMELEEELGISIDESEIEPGVFETLDSLCDFIISRPDEV